MKPFGLSHDYIEQIPDAGVEVPPEKALLPNLAYFNRPFAASLALPVEGIDDADLAAAFSGNQLPDDARPIAQAYAGHQFGQFNPQLGDGRAVVFGEVGRGASRIELSLKGSGRTPFSRGGDGKASLAPMLREVLISEAMAALGIPTTRSLAVVTTGEHVLRQRTEPGAVLTRTAASHLRVGTFQYFAARQQDETLKKLVDFAITRHYPELQGSDRPALSLLHSVAKRQAELIAQWMSVGFIHGVMNTDNMTISGETIDYGPCAFMERYDEQAVFSSIDRQGRYAYGNQPGIGQWNLARLAEALLPLLGDDEEKAVENASSALNEYAEHYEQHWQQRMLRKLGLTNDADGKHLELLTAWLSLLGDNNVDFTLAFDHLAHVLQDNPAPLLQQFESSDGLAQWLEGWTTAIDANGEARASLAARLRTVNPRIIPRNHRVEEALHAAALENDLKPFHRLLSVLQTPFSQAAEHDAYAQPADASFTARYQTFCGT